MEPKYIIRRAEEKDSTEIAKMAVRLKKLNEEFDTQFRVDESAVERGTEIAKGMISNSNNIVLIAEKAGKPIGFILAELRTRIFYLPKKEARITEFYIMPEFRRTNLGLSLLNEMKKEIKKLGISLLSAEFPTLNTIALKFYKKFLFREIISVYGTEISEAE